MLFRSPILKRFGVKKMDKDGNEVEEAEVSEDVEEMQDETDAKER